MNPLIVGAGFRVGERARELVEALGEWIPTYKVGLELYAAAGMPFVKELIGRGKDVFPGPEALRHRRDGEADGGATGCERRALHYRAWE